MEIKHTRSRTKRILHVFEDADEIPALNATLNEFIAEFHVRLLILLLPSGLPDQE